MGTWILTDPTSGKKLKVSGEVRPTDSEVAEIFASRSEPTAAPVSDPETSEPKSMGLMDAAIGMGDIIASGAAGAGEDMLAGYAGLIGGQNIPDAANIIGAVKSKIPDYEVGERGQQVGKLIAKAYQDYVPDEVKQLITQAQGAPEEVFQRGMDTSQRLRDKGFDTLASVNEFTAPIAATATGSIPTLLEAGGALKVPSVIGRTAATAQRVVSPEKRQIAKQLERQGIEGEYLPNGTEPTGTDLVVQGDPWTQGQPSIEGDDLGLSGYTTTTAPYKLNKYGKVIDNPKHKIAKDAGFSDSILGLVERANPETLAKYRKMIDSREKLYELPERSDKFDPTIVTGGSLESRLDVVKKVNKDSGQAIDRYVNNELTNMVVNPKPLMDDISKKMAANGVKLDPDSGTLSFGELELSEAGMKTITDIFDRMKKDVTGTVTGKSVHNLKRIIDEKIAYGKNVDGLDAKTQSILRDMRGSTKEYLESLFPEYAKANAGYSKSIDVIDRIQKAAGKVDLDGEYSMANLGRMSRAIMSQRISRDEIMTAINDLDALSASVGRVFKDDIRGQVHLANQMDDIWGPSRGTGFAGQTKQGAMSGAVDMAGGGIQGGVAVGRKAMKLLEKKQLDDKAKFKAMRKLLGESN
jgi:hypothetical protein